MNALSMIHNPVPFAKKKDKNYMGEVNIAVKLTNTVDAALAQRKALPKSKIRSAKWQNNATTATA